MSQQGNLHQNSRYKSMCTRFSCLFRLVPPSRTLWGTFGNQFGKTHAINFGETARTFKIVYFCTALKNFAPFLAKKWTKWTTGSAQNLIEASVFSTIDTGRLRRALSSPMGKVSLQNSVVARTEWEKAGAPRMNCA